MERHPGVYIDGGWHARAGRDTRTVVNPATEEALCTVEVASPDDVNLAVRSAEDALPGWAAVPLRQRQDIVERIRLLIAERAPELARLRAQSMGAPYKASLSLSNSDGLLRMYGETSGQVRFREVRRDDFGDSLVVRRPVGVVAGIVPWNVPVRNELKKTIPPLLMGCTVVLKPAIESPLVAGELMRIFTEAGVPPGVVNLVVGDGDTGEALVRHDAVRKIAFTGSTATGARIASLAAPQFKRLQLELGGKSAAIVCEDADLAAVVPSLVAFGFGNSGQICASLSRVLVPRSRQAELVDALGERAREHVLGDPMDEATTLGPLVTRAQRDRVLAHVRSGVDEGARLVVGGGRPAHLDRGWYVEPTIFADVDNRMGIAQEEIFGPVLSVVPYDSEAEAIRLANDSRYGLHGAVFSSDSSHALDVAMQIDSGTVAVNGFDTPLSAPFGGVKDSGVGRENGVEGYDSYVEYHAHKLPAELAAQLVASETG